MADICGDNRFEVIERAKQHLLEATNIDMSPNEMAVLNDFLFRCWQMGWLDRYDDTVDAIMPMTLENAINFLDEIGWRAEHDRIMSTPQWIPCEERLPDKNCDVLVTFIPSAGNLWTKVMIANYSDLMGIISYRIFWTGNYGKNDFVNITDQVSAWMPLPEPYKEETDEQGEA